MKDFILLTGRLMVKAILLAIIKNMFIQVFILQLETIGLNRYMYIPILMHLQRTLWYSPKLSRLQQELIIQSQLKDTQNQILLIQMMDLLSIQIRVLDLVP